MTVVQRILHITMIWFNTILIGLKYIYYLDVLDLFIPKLLSEQVCFCASRLNAPLPVLLLNE